MKQYTVFSFDNSKEMALLSNTLCRYRECNDYAFDALENDKLYFSIPAKTFNDPFDTLIYANPIVIFSRIYNSILNMDDYLSEIKKDNPSLAAYYALIRKNPNLYEKLYDFMTECNDLMTLIKQSLKSKTHVICFSELFDSMLMWSHYADQHKGFTLVFDKSTIESADAYTKEDIIISKKPILRKVNYVNTQIDLTNDIEEYLKDLFVSDFSKKTDLESFPQNKLKKMITEKSKDWSYEKEWRLIPRNISLVRESNLGYLRITPKAVIIGTQCSEDNSKKLSEICTKKNIPLLDINVNEFEPGFKLHVCKYEHR